MIIVTIYLYFFFLFFKLPREYTHLGLKSIIMTRRFITSTCSVPRCQDSPITCQPSRPKRLLIYYSNSSAQETTLLKQRRKATTEETEAALSINAKVASKRVVKRAANNAVHRADGNVSRQHRLPVQSRRHRASRMWSWRAVHGSAAVTNLMDHQRSFDRSRSL